MMKPPMRCIVQRTEEHAHTRGENSAGHLFALLSVCRLIYSEAALLLFTTNDFVFTSTYDLRKFVDLLTADQQKALQAIVLSDTLDDALHQGQRLRRKWTEAFTHLRSVMIVAGSATNPCEEHGCAVYKRMGWELHQSNNIKRNVRIVLAGNVQAEKDDLAKQDQDLEVKALTCQCESIYGFKMIDLGYTTPAEVSLGALSMEDAA